MALAQVRLRDLNVVDVSILGHLRSVVVMESEGDFTGIGISHFNVQINKSLRPDVGPGLTRNGESGDIDGLMAGIADNESLIEGRTPIDIEIEILLTNGYHKRYLVLTSSKSVVE